MKTDTIRCDVDAFPTAELIWLKNGDIIKDDDNFQILKDPSALIIKQMLPHLVGNYTCRVNNSLGSREMEFELQISGTGEN